MPKTPTEAKDTNKQKVLLSFLERTKKGDYAPIDESSVPYARILEERETAGFEEEEFYYGVS